MPRVKIGIPQCLSAVFTHVYPYETIYSYKSRHNIASSRTGKKAYLVCFEILKHHTKMHLKLRALLSFVEC